MKLVTYNPQRDLYLYTLIKFLDTIEPKYKTSLLHWFFTLDIRKDYIAFNFINKVQARYFYESIVFKDMRDFINTHSFGAVTVSIPESRKFLIIKSRRLFNLGNFNAFKFYDELLNNLSSLNNIKYIIIKHNTVIVNPDTEDSITFTHNAEDSLNHNILLGVYIFRKICKSRAKIRVII